MDQGQGSSVLPTGIAALRQLRATRRRRYVEQLDVMEVLYRVYLAFIFGGFGVAILAGAIHEAPATPAALDWMRANLAAVIGLLLATGLYAGLRSGSHGGPLAIEAAEVQHVLLAPIDRAAALRPAALRQLRVGALAGAALGAVVGIFVCHRLPGSPVEWIACLALFGALVPAAVLGAALVASGRHLRPLRALGLGLLLIAWSVADLALGTTSAPATMLGELAILPLQSGTAATLAAPGAALVLALLLVGLLGVGGTLLDAARRRSALVAELRFSASVSDLRTVILLRRQLASERSRRRPWLRLRSSGRFPVWRRGWQSFLRWPLARAVRVATIAVAAGVIAAAAWSGAAIALFIPGALLFVAALDLVEPLAQEIDHPTRLGLLPVDASWLLGQHLVAPAAALTGVVAIGAVAAAVIGGSAATALGVGAALLVPSGLLLACCAAFSVTADPYANVLSTPEIAYAITAAPLLVASVVVGLPLLIAHLTAAKGGSAVGAAFTTSIPLAILAAVAFPFLTAVFARRGALA